MMYTVDFQTNKIFDGVNKASNTTTFEELQRLIYIMLFDDKQDIDYLHFIPREQRFFDNIPTPVFKRDELKIISVALGKGIECNITYQEYCEYLENIHNFVLSKDEKELQRLCMIEMYSYKELIPIIRKNDMYALEEYLTTYIQESGYDVGLSSMVEHESKLIYDFNDHGEHLQGIKPTTKKYDVATQTLYDKLMLYKNVRYYENNCFPRERKIDSFEKSARYLTAIGVITSDMNLPTIAKLVAKVQNEDIEEVYNKSIEMLFN